MPIGQFADRLDVGDQAVIYRRCAKLGIVTGRRRTKSVAKFNYYEDLGEVRPCT